MKLSPYERLNLLNQFLILKHLEEIQPEKGNEHYYGAENFDNYVDILSEGYEGLYDEVFYNITDENFVSEEITDFVKKVIFMYDRGHLSYENLSEKEKSKFNISKIKFMGFDGNEEPDYYRVCAFIVNKLKMSGAVLFSKDSNGVLGKDVDSHMNMLRRYTDQLAKFKVYEHQNGGIMNLEQLNEVFE